jgi:hypothetical protein
MIRDSSREFGKWVFMKQLDLLLARVPFDLLPLKK